MPVFGYTEGLPNPPNLPANDVGAMNTNSVSVNRIFSNVNDGTLDNIGFNNPNGGYHNQVSMPNQAAPAVPAGLNGVLYTDRVRVNVLQGPLAFPHWRNVGGGSFAITGSESNTNPSPGINGRSFLAGGFLYHWGSALGNAAVVNFTVPFINNIFNIQATLIGPGGAGPNATVSISNPTVANFQYVISNNAGNFYTGIYWTAIGN